MDLVNKLKYEMYSIGPKPEFFNLINNINFNEFLEIYNSFVKKEIMNESNRNVIIHNNEKSFVIEDFMKYFNINNDKDTYKKAFCESIEKILNFEPLQLYFYNII